MKREDWTLLAVAAAEGKPLSPVQLQKSLFLLGEKCRKEVGNAFYRFVPYNYGPFDATIYTDAAKLAQRGLVELREPPGQGWTEYVATPSGLEAANRISREAPPRAATYLNNVVTWARGLSFSQLVRTIYAHYPRYRANSVFQN